MIHYMDLEIKMSETLKKKILLMTWIVGMLLTSLSSIPLVNATLSNTSLTIAVPSAPQGLECTIEATLKDENDNPIPNTDVGFYFCGTEKFGTATTDSNGVASLTYTFPRTETYEVNAIFSGSINYVQSSSEYIDIVVVDYIPYIAGGGLITVVVIGFVAYIIYRRGQ
jgi:hypothetical protein